MSQILLYRDENDEAHAAGTEAIEALKPGFRDKVGYRNARYFKPNETEKADTVIIVGSWPEVIKAYEGREGVDVVLVDEYETAPVEVVTLDEAAQEEKSTRDKAVTAVADKKLKDAQKHSSERAAARAAQKAEVEDAVAAKKAAKAAGKAKGAADKGTEAEA